MGDSTYLCNLYISHQFRILFNSVGLPTLEWGSWGLSLRRSTSSMIRWSRWGTYWSSSLFLDLLVSRAMWIVGLLPSLRLKLCPWLGKWFRTSLSCDLWLCRCHQGHQTWTGCKGMQWSEVRGLCMLYRALHRWASVTRRDYPLSLRWWSQWLLHDLRFKQQSSLPFDASRYNWRILSFLLLEKELCRLLFLRVHFSWRWRLVWRVRPYVWLNSSLALFFRIVSTSVSH